MRETITFNHYQELKSLPNTMHKSTLEEKLIQDCLVRGYLPANINSGYKKVASPYHIKEMEFDYATCVCSYVGKKQAPLIWAKEENKLRKLDLSNTNFKINERL